MTRLGLRLSLRCGVHTSRTVMLEELARLFDQIEDANADRSAYIRAIEQENCLGKRSDRSRKLTREYLVTLYGLDPNIPLFRVFRYFWQRDPEGRPLLAGICAFARDALLRQSAPFILGLQPNKPFNRSALELFLDDHNPGRFSKNTLSSVAGNLAASWAKMGLLHGSVNRYRTIPRATAGAVSFALFLGHLQGARGDALFAADPVRILDRSLDSLHALTEEASRRGWMVFNRVGKVAEVAFPSFLQPWEQEWLS
ncbi:MAG: hypothetical protein HQM04_12935 [Magnetococcales bacterium]|nr:hypothetical protein [Magnetococcales bacterium]MBF0115931.1 hypothetical protein [Magnetococcales bacterium]